MGALEGGIVFSGLMVIESRAGFLFGDASDWLIPTFIMGLVCGVIAGGVIGVLVALLDAPGSLGASIGSIVGLVLGLAIFVATTPLDQTIRLLAILVIPAGGSIGLLSAVLTAGRKASRQST